MPNYNDLSISIIGNGNVAQSLIPAIIKEGFSIDYVAGRNTQHLQNLAYENKILYTTDYDKLSSKIIIISVSDNAIESVVKNLNTSPHQLILHTAGSIALETIKQYHAHCGAIYPLQCFSKQRILSFRSIPLCIESSDEQALKIITHLAAKLSDNVTYLSSEERLSVHTAAVFVSNYTNLMYAYGADILDKKNINFSILHPLITEVAQKALVLHPSEAQSGPSLRRDTNTLELHKNQLDDKMKNIYTILSQWVQEKFPSS